MSANDVVSLTDHFLGRGRRGVKPWSNMVVAKASGWVECDGEREWVKAGVTQIARWHPILKAAPNLFGLRAATSTHSTRSRASRPSDDIELCTSSTSPIAVVLDESAKTRIVNEVLEWASNHEGEGRETGGYLFGKRINANSSYRLGPREANIQ